MTDLLPLFWPLVDAPDPVISPSTIASWPDGALKELVELGILQPAENAEFVLCPECFDHEEEVVALTGPGQQVRFMIPCPEVLRVEVPPQMLLRWTINFSNLIGQLANALPLSGKIQEMIPERLWRLGRWEISGRTHDLLFARRIGANGSDLQTAFASLRQPIVLFAGDVPPDDSWQERRSTGVSIPFVATCTVHGIAIDREELAALVQPAQDANPMNVASFRRQGEFWVLRFGGETVYLKDSVGLAYIARLLSEPQRDIPAVSLLAVRAGIDPLISTGSAGEVLDVAARATYATRYQDLCEELEDAMRHHDEGRIMKLQEEMEQLSTELASATGLGGRGRKKSDAERVRIAVSMAVRRAIETISEHHASLGRHLLLSISSGQVFRYSPDSHQEWDL